MKKFIVLTAVAVLAIAISNASAGMSWQRGDAGSTWQDWTFDTNANPATPETYSNPGTPSAAIIAEQGEHVPEPGWKDGYLGRNGVWAGDPLQITLDIPNFPEQNPYKEIWIEMEYFGFVSIADILTPESGVTLLEISETAVGDGWKIGTIGWRIEPNPAHETIYIEIVNSGAYLNYLTVDTICVPEPATMVLLGLGGLLMRKRK